MKTHWSCGLVVLLSLLPRGAQAWWGDSDTTPTAFGGAWATTGDCGNQWYVFSHFTSCAARGFNATFNCGFGWNGRGFIHMDWVNGGAKADTIDTLRYRKQDGSLSGATTGWNDCAHTCSWQPVLGDTETGDMFNWNGMYINADESTSSTCGSVCGIAPTCIREIHMYGDKWVYLNDWIVFGGYGNTVGVSTVGWSPPFGESGVYVYGAIDTTHGNYFANNLYGGKTPYRVSTGDCGNAGLGNYLNFKGNAGANGNNNCDNCDAYAFAYCNTGAGAGPMWGVGSDDGDRIWLNGTMIADNNTARGQTWDQDRFLPTGMAGGWNRVLFKVHNGGGGFSGVISLHNGGDFRQVENSVNTINGNPPAPSGDRYGGYSVGYEQDAWFPTITVSSFSGNSSPTVGAAYYGNNSTVAANGSSAGSTSPAPGVPYWQTMQYMWGYGMGGADSNYAPTTGTPTSTSWSDSITGVTGHRRFHYFAVSKSGRTSGQASGSSGSWTYDSGHAKYYDLYVDNVAPVTPAFSSVTAASTTQINLAWTIPLDQGVGVANGSTESAGNISNNTDANNFYRRGDVGVQVYRNGSTAISAWSASALSFNDTALTANTAYTYTLEARDNTSQTRGAWNNATGQKGTNTTWTLSVPPAAGSIAPDNTSPSVGSPVMWTAVNGFGAGKVQYYRYVFDTSATHTFTDTESQWSTGTVATTPTSAGTWYLHVKGYNGANVGNGTFNYSVTASNPIALSCFNNKFVECGSAWSFDQPSSSGGCCAPLNVIVQSTVTNGSGCSYSVTQTWQATDCCTNSATCSQTVFVRDTTPPLIVCSSNKTAECGATWSFDQPSASDVCCGTNVTIVTLSTVTNPVPGVVCGNAITRTWRATDCCTNSSTCSQTVTVLATHPPNITCGTNRTVECGSTWAFDAPAVSDDCCGTNVTVSVVSTVTNANPVLPCGQDITRTWEAVDCCQNHAQCSQTVTVADTTPPVMTCASNKVVECGSTWVFDPPTASDICCGTNVSIVVIGTFTNAAASSPCSTVIMRKWQATDCCGNHSECSQVVTVVDTTPPTINCSQDHIENLECGLSWDFSVPIIHDDCDPSPLLSILSTTTNGTCPGTFTAARVWLVSDHCGNSTTCTQIVNSIDDQPPQLTCAANKRVECGSEWAFDPPSAFDGCCGTNITISILSTVTNATPGALCGRDITRTWQATDCCSNSSTCSQTVTLTDTTPPVFNTHCVTNHFEAGTTTDDFNGPEPTSPSAGLLQREAGATLKGFDDCTVNAAVVHTFANLPPCITAARVTLRLKACGENCCNDSIALFFTGPSGALVPGAGTWSRTLGSSCTTLPGLFSDDWCNHTSGNVLVLDLAALPLAGSGTTNLLADLNANGFLDFSLQDDSAIDYITLDVVSCCCAPDKTVECGSQWTFDTPTAVDACCGTNVTVTLLNTVTNLSVNADGTVSPCSQMITATWLATDCCGNTNTCSQTVTVTDTTPPTVDCPPGIGVICGTPWDFGQPTAYDACCGNQVSITVSGTVTNGHGCDYFVTRSWRITDCCGNSTNCSQTIQVGGGGPELTCATNKMVECGSDWTFDPPTVADPCCGDNVTISVLDTVTNLDTTHPCTQYVTRTWQAIDCCDKMATCSQTVTVVDTTPPIISCTASKTVECGSDWRFDRPAAYDLCCGDQVTITVIGTVTNSTAGTLCSQDITRTWEATDCCGNRSTCSQTVMVRDTTPPVFTTHCVTNHYEAGLINGTSASPSADLLARIGPNTKDFGDCTVNRWVAHTFANLPPCITSAKLTVHLKPCGDNCENDDIGVWFTTPSGGSTNDWTSRIGTDGNVPGLFPDNWCNHTAGETVVLDLANMPITGANLIGALNQYGFMDFICEDDTAVDYVILDVVSCCCAPDKTVECGSEWTFDAPTATDACCGDNVTITLLNTVTNVDTTRPCTQHLTASWLATDCCGNTNTCSQTVTVVDTTPPVITCGLGKGVICGTDWSFDEPSAYDVCCVTRPRITVVGTVTNGHGCDLLITRTWMATDCCGNSSTCSQTVQVGSPGPTITCAPGKGVICSTPWDFDPPTADAPCCETRPVITVVGTVTNGHGCDLRITRTWQVTDCCDKTATCSQTVQVGGYGPFASCAPDKKIACGSPVVFDPPRAFDPCCTEPLIIQPLGTVTNGICPASITQTWEIRNCCGNTVTCSQTISVVPCVPAPAGYALWLPFDEASGPTSANLYPGGNNGTQVNGPAVGSGYVANSLCFDGFSQYVTVPDYPAINPGTGDLSIDAWVKRDSGSGNIVRVIVDKRDPNTGIGYSLSVSFGNLVFQMADWSGFTNYRDTLGTVPADDQWHFVAVTVNRASTTGGQFYVDNAATDKFDPTGQPGSLSNPSAFEVGASAITSGNSPWLGCIDEVEFFGRVLDPAEIQTIFNAGPAGKCKVPLLACAAAKVVACGSAWTFDPPHVNSPCCGDKATVVVLNTVTNSDPIHSGYCFNAAITRTWQATDCCGHTATCSQEVDIWDLTPVPVTCAQDKTVQCGTPWTFDLPIVSTNCCPTARITGASTVTNGFCPQRITRTWVAGGCCPGNTNTCSQTVTVVDTTPPVIHCPTNKTVLCGSGWTFDTPTATDNCCFSHFRIVADAIQTGNIPCQKIYQRYWRAVDCCGNESAECNQVVTENAPPCDPVVIASITYSAGVVTISFPTKPCLIYEVQHKNNLGIFTSWITFQTVNGTGGVVSVTDAVGHPSQFYRVICRCQ